MPKLDQHRRAFGQFFTPNTVVGCCYSLIEDRLPSIPTIADPACGDGAFLRYALTNGLSTPEHIQGCELDAQLVAELVRSGLAGIRHADGLARSSLAASAFDLVVGNPPFGVATSSEGHTRLASEVRFLLRALELARPGGLVALVLPSGILANERLQALRADLLARCTVLAVIALPRGTFRHMGTHAACSIVLLHNAPAGADHHVLFALPNQLEELAAVVATYRRGRQASTQAAESAHVYWLRQTAQLARRLDAHFWQPAYRQLIERLGTFHQLRPLGELLNRRDELIAGDHVRPSHGEAKGAGLPHEYYQTREFMAAGYNYARIERCDELAYRRLRHTAVQQYDILVSCAGRGGAGRGRVCLVLHQPGTSCTGDVLILRARRLSPIFLFLFLASHAGRSQLLRLQNGVGTVNLSVDELLQIEVPLVELDEQLSLASSYAPIVARHHAAMSALLRGDQAAFERKRAETERRLAELLGRVDGSLITGEGR